MCQDKISGVLGESPSGRMAQVIHLLSDQIIQEMNNLHAEEHFPRHDSDASDDYISSQQEKIDTLVNVRREIEFIAAGYDSAPGGKRDLITASTELCKMLDDAMAQSPESTETEAKNG